MGGWKGFLTNADRAFLNGHKEYNSKQGRYERRRAIRERTQSAFLDFTLLYTELPEDEREKIFEILEHGRYETSAIPGDDASSADYEDAKALDDGLFSVIGFIYLGVFHTSLSFEELVEAAVFQAERDKLDRPVEVTLSIKGALPIGAIESAIKKLELGEPERLDTAEAKLLVEFITDPTKFQPASQRNGAIERLNTLDHFSLPLDDEQ